MKKPNRLAAEALDTVLTAACDNDVAQLTSLGITPHRAALLQRLRNLPRDLSVSALGDYFNVSIDPTVWDKVEHLVSQDHDAHAALYYLRLGAPRAMLLHFGFSRRTYELARQTCDAMSLRYESKPGRLVSPDPAVVAGVRNGTVTSMDACVRLSTELGVTLKTLWAGMRHVESEQRRKRAPHSTPVPISSARE